METQQCEDRGESLSGPVEAADESDRFKRWAWLAIIWLAALGALTALLAGGKWLYESNQREQTLALLARTAVRPAPAMRPAMELPAFAPPVAALPEPAFELPPPPLPLRTITPPAPATSRPKNQLSETLRQCRTAGYHAAQCLQRGCAATRHGLACRG